MNSILVIKQNLRMKLNNLRLNASRFLGDALALSPKTSKYEKINNITKKKVLIVGVVLQDRKNHYKHISSILSGTESYEVHQLWAVLKANEHFQPADNIKHIYFDDFIPRSRLINSMIEDHSDGDFDFILIIDDDIRLPKHFLDQFLAKQEKFNFSLAQPARTPDSIISHQITKQNMNLSARQTLFVEIGPLVSIRRDAQRAILPLDEESPMGWGLDYVWSALLKEKELKMGIIDATPIAHTLRPVGKSYDSGKAMAEMKDFLLMRPHLSEIEAHVVLHKFI